MTSTHDLISSIPSYMIPIISARILGDAADQRVLAEGLSDTDRLETVIAALTDKQRECFDLHYNEDLSLAEIAEQLGVSRQGVWDNIRRAETAMEDIEAKTGLLRRFEENRRELESLLARLEALTGMTQGEAQNAAKAAAEEVRAIIARG